uniref:Uncharacterized protein n=1 Tax=Bionectria ochroleuca TaxID=29856 RepID=A0A8H7NJ69_BIOOC
MFDLNGKVALVIGLGQSGTEGWGIGAACAITLARQGAVIFGGNRTIASTTKTTDTLRDEGLKGEVMQADATSSESVKALVDACIAKHGCIDILVCNVGQSQPGACRNVRRDLGFPDGPQLEKRILGMPPCPSYHGETGKGWFYCLRFQYRRAPLHWEAPDCIQYHQGRNHAVREGYSCHLREEGVRLNTVVPGLMETPYTKELFKRHPVPGGYEEFKATRDNQVPMGHMGDAWDVANAALFLASDEARYVTGQKIVVDGGITSSTGHS